MGADMVSEERMQQLVYFLTIITRELRTKDVNAFKPQKLFNEILNNNTSHLYQH